MPKNIRPIRVEGQLAYVPLTQGYEAVIDASDVLLVAGVNWSAVIKNGSTVYAMRTDRTGKKQRSIYLHRVIIGEPKSFDVDHIDGNGLNNQRLNLRLATRSQNNCNSRKQKNNQSGFKGVSWDKQTEKWKAQIMVNKKQKNLGRFVTRDDAYKAYQDASKEHHGVFGKA